MIRNRVLVAVSALAVAAAALGGVLLYRQLFRDDAPAAVSLADAVAGAATGQAQPVATSAGGRAAAPAASPAVTTTPAGSPLAGGWTLVPSGSFVGYRVNEQLAGIGAKTAVGRTSAITGSLSFDGRAITAVEVTADLRRLQSDDDRRDRTLSMQALETSRFPSATFVLAAPITVAAAPAEGATVRVTASGDLTLHGVTRRIELPLEGQLSGGRVVVVGSLDVRFADYGIAQPRALAVLSVEDHGLLELQLVFARG
jgi:polyisoprenoid-binding protein YceI